ncbi:anthocyanin regulatory Lc protein-like isoform X1 [Oryza brachyantha]|uniref:anthocyanin regulatory Lc protein-like isoform X1 n=1 Tax=Oryza brachyantha TaxID=4533 RepID=UPI0007763D99|nr:anthocyanin regulatory Lc protein-like isoform X1 [Oryza brachyantha]XP_040379643.1 anthocyanin regulatory Lc protein-like isoform X1 [Oryza brachyantha]
MEEPLLPSGNNFRSKLAAAVRSINWTYAIFWSISTSRPGVLTWKDGFYNGEIKTRKITNSRNLTADELVLQRSEQLRELYDSLLSGECDHRARRPPAALSPEDLADTEWYYVICMTYAFRPGQGLPGKSFASNEFVWLSNAHSADRKTFQRVLIAKSASIKTILCVPFMHGVLELGTTDPVSEDAALVDRIAASFGEEPSSIPPSNDEAGDADVVFEDLDHADTVEAMVPGERRDELGLREVAECGSNALDLEQITMEIGELYGFCEELDDVGRSLEDSSWAAAVDPWSFQLVPTSSSPEAARAATVVALDGRFVDGSCRSSSCFVAWKRTGSDEVAVPFAGGESQRLLKKAVAGGGWVNNGDGAAVITPGSSIKNHVMSERRRREKLNEMFLILKSVVPSIHKVDKASILAETIAYLKELEKRVQELESSSQPSPCPTDQTRRRRCREITGKKVSAGVKRKASTPEAAGSEDEDTDGEERHHHRVSNVNVTVMETKEEVLLEVQCQWKELLMARVFDAIKGVSLDVLSVKASTSHSLLKLKIQAKVSAAAKSSIDRSRNAASVYYHCTSIY